MSLAQLVDALRRDEEFMSGVTAWKELDPQEPRYAGFPPGLHPQLRTALQARGIARLYAHQAEAIQAALEGQDVAVATPTASGKSLCYHVPVLQALLEDPHARALYLFPTKALAQDQRAELAELARHLGFPLRAEVYDGDTPASLRPAIRVAGQIVLTNPDMLHAAILPHHTRWLHLFRGLRYVVVDEMHTYRGIFGSHVANVLRRLQRVAAFYGAQPRFILCSATLANPEELAEKLVGRPVRVIRDSGAPLGRRHLVLYNPPLVDRRLGLRRSALLEARRLVARLVQGGVQTIAFARSRTAVEVLLSYLREDLRGRIPRVEEAVQGYRGGYLPSQRRAIEQGLRQGTVRAVVATHALELGIDIGSLEAAVLVGYPGSVSSFWQQVGRAGRQRDEALAVLIATPHALDQYVVRHPEYLLGQPPEAARIHPDNVYVLMSHLQCAAFELPFRDGEPFGSAPADPLLAYLEQHGVLRHVEGRWHWMADRFPASDVSLRSASQENVVIVDVSQGARAIGEVDKFSAPLLVHEQAIYLHGGQQYQVERFDYRENKAYVRPVSVDYFTQAHLAVDVKVLDVFQEEPGRAWGEVAVAARPTLFKKIKLHTHENLGWGKIHLPEQQMHTTACWFTFPPELLPPPQREAALMGLASVLGQVAALYLLCDPHDLYALAQARWPFTGLPTVLLYDAVPGGAGLAERAFLLARELMEAAAEVIRGCPCASGCPSCVGPPELAGREAKAAALALLEGVRARGLG